jgi:hypothetical protein
MPPAIEFQPFRLKMGMGDGAKREETMWEGSGNSMERMWL